MKTIVVEQYLKSNAVNVYVFETEVGYIESEEFLKLFEAYSLIEKFKKQYGIKEIKFIVSSDHNTIIDSDIYYE